MDQRFNQVVPKANTNALNTTNPISQSVRHFVRFQSVIRTATLCLLLVLGSFVNEVWAESYTYIVINHSGEQAIKETVTETSGQAPDITRTTKIASPLVTKWFYYSDEECTTTMSTLPAGDATVYVRYSHTYNRELFNLNRNVAYQIMYGDYYFSNNSNNKDLRFFQSSATELTSTPGYASWTFDGNDPYRIQLFNYATTNGYPFLHATGTDAHMYPGQTPSATDTKYFTILNSPTLSGKYIVAAVCVPDGKYKALRKNGQYAWGRVEDAVSSINNDDCCFTIVNNAAIAPLRYNYTYYVVNKSGEVTVWNFCQQSAGTAPHIPDIIKTPLLADNAFHYYTYSDSYRTADKGVTYGVWSDREKWNIYSNNNDAVPYGKYTIPSGTAELTTLPAADTKILVTYDANATIQEVNGLTIDLSGGTAYNIKLHDGYLYAPTTSTFGRNRTAVAEATLATTPYLWSLGGNDPYNIQLRNESVGNDRQLAIKESTNGQKEDAYYTTSNQSQAFTFAETSTVSRTASGDNYPFNAYILMQGNDGYFELMSTYQKGMSKKTGNDDYAYAYAYTYLATLDAGADVHLRGVFTRPNPTATNAEKAGKFAHGGSYIQALFTPSLSNCGYNFKLVRNGAVESTVTVADQPAGGSIASILPAGIQDTNASGYLFYPTQADALAGTNAITTLPYDKSLSVDIFVVRTYAAVSVTYRIINKSSKLVFGDITGTFTPDNTPEENLPNAYQSPLATNYRFYTNGGYNSTADTYTPTNPIDQTSAPYIPAANDVIYVLYDYNPSNSVTMGSNTLTIDLTGNTVYKWNLQSEASPRWQMVNGSTSTVSFNGKSVTRVQLDQSHTETPSTWTNNFFWTLEGSDPYNIVIRNATYPDYFYSWQNGTGSPTGKTHKYIWNEEQASASGAPFVKHWVLLTGNKLFSENAGDGYVLFHHNDGWANRVLYTNIASNSEADVLFSLPDLVIYHVVNKSNKIAISKTVTPATGSISMPTELKTPYITGDASYLYFGSQADAYAYSSAADAAARTTAAAKAISGAVHAGQVVYVGYYYDDTARPSALPTLDGSLWYKIVNQNTRYLKAYNNGNLSNSYSIYDGTEGSDDYFMWMFTGNDPYDIHIQNKGMNGWTGGVNEARFNEVTSTYSDLSYAANGVIGASFIMLKKSEGNYTLAAVNNAAKSNNYYLVFLGLEGGRGRMRAAGASDSPVYIYENNDCNTTFKTAAVGPFVFHVTTSSGAELTETVLAEYDSTSRIIALTSANGIHRKFCDYTYYLDAEHTQPVTDYYTAHHDGTTDAEGTHIYVTYSLATSCPFIFSNDYAHATWYRLTMNNKYMFYNNTNINYSNEEHTEAIYQFAVTGDPYELKVWSRGANNNNLYLGVPKTAVEATEVFLYEDSEDNYTTWEIVDKTGYASDQFILRRYGSSASPMYATVKGGYGLMKYSTDAQPTKLIALPTADFTYNIVDQQGRIAIKYTVNQQVTAPLNGYESIPEAIRSPFISDETISFYGSKTDNGTSSDGRAKYIMAGSPLTELPATASDIYVTYTVAKMSQKVLRLGGARTFDMRVNGNNAYANGTAVANEDKSGLSAAEKETFLTHNHNYLWKFTSNDRDPYAVRISNVDGENYITHTNPPTTSLSLGTAEANTYYILTKCSTSGDDIIVEVMAATGDDAATKYYNIGRNTNIELYPKDTYSQGADQLKIILSVARLTVKYHIVDLQGNVVVSDIESDAATLGLPAEWISPLATNYQYWGGAARTGTLLSSPSDADDGNIYVTYEPTTTIDLDGRNSDTKQLYLLQFKNGVSFRQESSDAVMSTESKAVYPYSNGDASFYVYGDAQWADQQFASSTRTRWAWYIEGGDPYRAKISSFQTQTTQDGTARHAYLRTYKPADYSEVVTGSITDNTVASSAGAVPSEYMILGTAGNYILKTVNEIDDGTTTERRTVNSFEQYWKNNPTVRDILNEAGKGVGSQPVTYAMTTEQKEVIISGNRSDWHTYEDYANAAPWNDTSTGGKAYGYGWHWYQTIRMDYDSSAGTYTADPVFDLVPVDLNGVLILLDNHGWEVMRKPLGRTDDAATKATRDAAIKVYDSPMVIQYHFWTNYDKVPGYHKYKPHTNDTSSKNATEKGTGSSLADYPQVMSNGMVQDLYVTYDVKPEYSECYTGTATGGTSNFSYILRQDGYLAQASDASTLTQTAVPASLGSGSTEDINDNMMWYLKPNFDIDREMGYLYSGETGAEAAAESKEDTNAAYTTTQQGFDPYNVQIQSAVYTTSYFQTAFTSAALADGVWSASGSTAVSIGTLPGTKTYGSDAYKYSIEATGYDDKTCRITNATFMAVQDANGNMRLMPRFDHTHVIQNFTLLADPAGVQPVEDKTHGQTTLLYRNQTYTYIVVDNHGREALRYSSLSSGAPVIPLKFQSPLATNFTFWKTLPQNEGTYDLESINDQITGTLTGSGYTGSGFVYVRYDYSSAADVLNLLKGTWFTMQVNSTDVWYANGIKSSASSKDATASVWQWRLMQSAGDTPDPYAVQLYNASVKNGTPEVLSPLTINTADRFVILSHPSDATDDYAFMVAGNNSTAAYTFLSGSNLSTGATTVIKNDYNTNGSLSTSEALKFSADVYPSSVVYKIITHTGKVALTSASETVSSPYKPSLPEWMQSPLMKSNAYHYYAGLNADGTVKEDTEIETVNSLDGGIVYVHYDYTTSRQPVTYTNDYRGSRKGAEDYLDLSGSMAHYLLSYDYYWNNSNNDATIVSGSNSSNVKLGRSTWLLTGNDPYEITIINKRRGNDYVICGKESDESNDAPVKLLKETDDDYVNYPYRTFMVLKGDDEYEGLILVATGTENLVMRRNGDGVTNITLYHSPDNYSDIRLGHERTNNKGKKYVIGQDTRFQFIPSVVYNIITNSGVTALSAESGPADTKIRLPQWAQTPLISLSDFTYYSQRPEIVDGAPVPVEGSAIAFETGFEELQGVLSGGDVYVRYSYSQESSPFKVASGFDLDYESNYTLLDWENEVGLDLSGGTWYNLGNMQNNMSEKPRLIYTTDVTGGLKVSELKTFTGSLSNKAYLWRLEGNDPYAIRIMNGNTGNGCYSIADNSTNAQMAEYKAAGYPYQTFMFLGESATDNQDNRLNTTHYELKRWMVMIPTAYPDLMPLFMAKDNGSLPNVAYTGSTGVPTSGSQPMRLSSTSVVDEWNMIWGGGGSSGGACLEFVKAPVARKYRFHAIKYNGSTKIGETWEAILEHDWLMPVVLEDEIARLYTKYETKSDNVSDAAVTGTGVFKTRIELDNVAQFYSDPEMTRRLYDEDEITHTITYDVYPSYTEADDGSNIPDIYFKYQSLTNSELSALDTAVPFRWSTEENINTDVAYREAHGQMDKSEMKANWFFMVLDTDDGISRAVNGDTKTYVGNQYFLRRENDGSIGWMNNAYALHHYSEDNYNGWDYNRLAEWYRPGDNSQFRESRWLWAFTGDPYNMKIINMESALGVVSSGVDTYSLKGAQDCFVNVTKNENGDYPVSIPTSRPTENYGWGLCPGYDVEETFSLMAPAITESATDAYTPLFWQMTGNGVMAKTRVTDRQNAIQVLPYVPNVYQDVMMIIRSDSDTGRRTESYDPFLDKTNYKLITTVESPSGTSRFFASKEDRLYAKGDKIRYNTYDDSPTNNILSDIPLELRRKFCKYSMYSDQYTTRATADYEVTDAAAYQRGGSEWPQKVFIEYHVTTDMFLNAAPSSEDIAANRNVYFMDYIDSNGDGEPHYHNGYHAYYDRNSQEQDANRQYRTVKNRMQVAPENLKWYFVGDPYKLQVYNTRMPGYNLRRIDDMETTYAYLHDCVNMARNDNETYEDTREIIQVYEYDAVNGVYRAVNRTNPNKGTKSPKFYWEVVPCRSDKDDDFALRFKADNTVYSYNNVYFYLNNHPSSHTYKNVENGEEKSYNVDLSYYGQNLKEESGEWIGYHKANTVNNIIRLTKPTRVYVTTYKGDEATPKAKEELSEYFAIGETLTDVPQHLRRPYCDYTMKDGSAISHTLTGEAKIDVKYTVTTDNPFSTIGSPKWYDMAVASYWNNTTHQTEYYWMQDDNTKQSGFSTEAHAIQDVPKLKAFHWAFIGDPYEFKVINRRQQERTADNCYVVRNADATSILYGADGETAKWGFNVRKPTGDNSVNENLFFWRTSSLKTTAGDTSDNSDNYPNASNTTNDFKFVQTNHYMAIFSLDESHVRNMAIITLKTVEEEVKNDCFDAKLRVYNAKGELVASTGDKTLEVPFISGDAANSYRADTYDVGIPDKLLPADIRRWGCTYRAYKSYDAETGEFSDEITEGFQPGVFTDNTTIYVTYTVTEDAEQFFTTSAQKVNNEFVWMNPHFFWKQRFTSTVATGGRYVDDTSNPIYYYDINGKLVETKYPQKWVEETVNLNTDYDQYGWLNSHDSSTQAYGDEKSQNSDNKLKWSLTGDPYNFELRNYAEWQSNSNSLLVGNATGGTSPVQFSTYGASQWTLKTDSTGTPYLALVDVSASALPGSITQYVTFDRYSSTEQEQPADLQYLKLVGGVTTSPDGNTLNTSGAYRFLLAMPQEMAALVIYHLNLGAATKRDGTAYQIDDYTVTNIPVGNRPNAPWYMRRQFCQYTYKLKKVEKIKTPATAEQAAEWEDDPEATGIGSNLTVLTEAMKDRKITIDVDYTVDAGFRFATAAEGSQTTAWYTLGTGSDADGLVHLNYNTSDISVGGDQDHHYTNDYLWAPVGDPYGFELHNRYATVNGGDFANKKPGIATIGSIAADEALASKNTTNQSTVFEMYEGNSDASFLLHPVAANSNGDVNITWENPDFTSYFVQADGGKMKMKQQKVSTVSSIGSANWYLSVTPQMLLPYYERAGYVGGLKPDVAASSANLTRLSKLNAALTGSTVTFSDLDDIRKVVYAVDAGLKPVNLVPLAEGYFRFQAMPSTDALKARYMSGYRHQSELTASVPMHFYETTEALRTVSTFSSLASGFTSSAAAAGNIEILPVEYDAASIFHVAGSDGQFRLMTQGLEAVGHTMAASGGTSFYMEDIGGTCVTVRTENDRAVASYLNYDPSSYQYDVKNGGAELAEATDGTQYTKWMLQQAGTLTDAQHNQMPLRLEVNHGGKVSNEAGAADDEHYYATLYVPFDVRIGSSADQAYTGISDPAAGATTMTLTSVSGLTQKGNSQFVPAAWPVVIQAMYAYTEGSVQAGMTAKNYIALNLPNTSPETGLPTVVEAGIKLEGQYLEQTLGTTKTVHVFGLPFKDHTTEHSDGDASHHQYDPDGAVGFYKNDNWARESYNDATGRTATDSQRDNKYVYPNKVYYQTEVAAGTRSWQVVFDDNDGGTRSVASGIDNAEGQAPWPCDVYDLQGRKVAQQETPATLRKNHPSLERGVYIFAGRKVVVK